MSDPKGKNRFTDASWFWVWALVGALTYELVMIGLGRAGGALSQLVWAAVGEPYTWRWALVGAPIVGLLAWSIFHFLFQWGTGVDLLIFIAGTLVVLGCLVLFLG